jgi:mRNA-degrading endonuclease toxin of MazEF toxin-antitoxin module
MAPGEIFLANFHFGETPGVKLRPVLVLTAPVGTVPEVVVAYISSVMPEALSPFDVVIHPSEPAHTGTHLKTVSVLRLHKLGTIPVWSLARRLGKLSDSSAQEVGKRLRAMLAL